MVLGGCVPHLPGSRSSAQPVPRPSPKRQGVTTQSPLVNHSRAQTVLPCTWAPGVGQSPPNRQHTPLPVSCPSLCRRQLCQTYDSAAHTVRLTSLPLASGLARIPLLPATVLQWQQLSVPVHQGQGYGYPAHEQGDARRHVKVRQARFCPHSCPNTMVTSSRRTCRCSRDRSVHAVHYAFGTMVAGSSEGLSPVVTSVTPSAQASACATQLLVRPSAAGHTLPLAQRRGASCGAPAAHAAARPPRAPHAWAGHAPAAHLQGRSGATARPRLQASGVTRSLRHAHAHTHAPAAHPQGRSNR